MNHLKTLALGLLTSGSLLIIGPMNVQAQSSTPPGEAGPASEESVDYPMTCEPWPEKLGLTDEQMEKLISLKSECEVKTAEKKAQLMTDKEQMMLLMTEEKTDKGAILSLNEKMSSLKSDLSAAHINKMIEAMAIMTTKQKEQIHHHILIHVLSRHSMDKMSHHGHEHHHH